MKEGIKVIKKQLNIVNYLYLYYINFKPAIAITIQFFWEWQGQFQYVCYQRFLALSIHIDIIWQIVIKNSQGGQS